MGKKKSTKHHASALAAKKKQMRPDDYFCRGPIEMARFGKHVVMRNNMTPDQHRQFLIHVANQLPSVTTKIDSHVAAIVQIVEIHNPLSLLQRGYWASVLPHLAPSEESEKKSDVIGQRMLDYIQSVVAAVRPKVTPAPDVTEDDWGKLSFHVEKLFDTINHEYLRSRIADWKINGGGPPEDQVEFYERAMAMWCNVTGHRYHFHEIAYLRELIMPHSDVFQQLWGICAEEMVEGFSRILHSLTCGLGESMDLMDQANEEYLAAEKNAAGDETALQHQLEILRCQDGVQDALGCLFGVNLFKIDHHLTTSLLDDLSWSPGECLDFIDQSPQSGWPTRIWPRTRRPFLKIDDAYYCFDVHTLFDNIYRVLERTVREKDSSYAQTWNERQKDVSEGLPFKLFGKLLPGAQSWRSVYYEIGDVDARGRRKWCEVDGLLAYDDHLFIIEVKGGTFTAASPEGGFDSHLKSIERLIFSPVDQGERFLHWLDNQETVVLCDERHRQIGVISRSDFAHVTICAVSLDPFTELSAKAYHLRHLMGRPGATPFWALSLSDLLTYSDLFENPLVFLHFVEKRNQATASGKVILDDELDHYGMYLEHNNYDWYAEEVAGSSPITWTGYRTPIDQYFSARTRELPATLPSQDIPLLYSKIITVLADSQHTLRRQVASLLLDGDGKMKKDVEFSLHEALSLQIKFRRARPLSIGGKDVRITFVCWQPGAVEPTGFDAAAHCKAGMLLAGESDRWLIQLYFSTEQELCRVEPEFFTAKGLTEAEKNRLAIRVEQLRIQRHNQTLTKHGHIGRNQLCPCGSGKKYKRCCKD